MMIAIRKTMKYSSLIFSAGLLFAILTHLVVKTYLYVCFLNVLELSIFIGTVSFFRKKKSHLDLELENQIFFSSSLIGILFSFLLLTTAPLNIDRSFSVWMLNQISIEEKQGRNPDITDISKKLYLFVGPAGGEAERRISEQISLGNIENMNGKIILTSKGRFQAQLDRIIARVFNTNKKYAG